MNNMELEIGQKVFWKVGKLELTGCFLEDCEDGFANVVLHLIGNIPGKGRLVKVRKDMLIKNNKG